LLEQLIKALILGIIQGLTEWLPISSTGHLKIVEHYIQFLTPENTLLFEFTLHIGTLIVVFLFFRTDIKNILSALAHLDFHTENGKLVPLIIVGTIPAAIIGVVLQRLVTSTFQNLLPIATAVTMFGIILYITKTGKEKTDQISYLTAALIGIAEGIAVIPGVSRSGATIAVALLLGIRREKAFEFSFLLSIPAIIGAIGYTYYQDAATLATAGLDWATILIGITAAMITGYLALKLLWKILANKKFHYFAAYCWLLGITLIALTLSGF
jgi:undecaprenyl-diphosphatase